MNHHSGDNWIQDRWHHFEDFIQDHYRGDYGAATYDGVLIFIIMYGTHEALLHHAPPHEHPHINAVWYGSILPMHPYHKYRDWYERKIANLGAATYDPDRHPLQQDLKNYAQSLHNRISRLVDERDHGHDDSMRVKGDWVNDQVGHMQERVRKAAERHLAD